MLAVERAYAAGTPVLIADPILAAAAAGAVASRYLAVGTPRSIGLIAANAAHAAASLAAHRTWFAPRDLRCHGFDPAALAAGGTRAASRDEALAADIVCIHVPLALAASQLRRGTHVNALAAVELPADLPAVIVRAPDLVELAAGRVDGRQLDELTVFILADS